MLLAMPTLVAQRAVTPDGVVGPVRVEVEGARIVAVEPAPATGRGTTLVPGFVDIQVNGIDDVDVAAAAGGDWDRLDELLLAQGTTTWCPTLVTMPLDAYARPLARILEARARTGGPPRPTIAGAHLEGPFLGGAPGAHPPELIRAIDRDWLAALPDGVAVITLGAEQDDLAAAVADLVQRGTLVSLGHSTAGYEAAARGAAAGARLVTHAFNGMAPFHHRDPGLLGAALTDDRLAVSLIADLVHVHPAALRLAFRAKGRGGVVLVTDAVAWRAARVGGIGIEHRDGAPRLPDGTLAGSALTMDAAVRNVVDAAGIPLADAVQAAGAVPARLLGLTDRGRLEPGALADLVLLDDRLEVAETWVAGQLAYPH
jgi:N-acetylglucosamine-6-phosphate deacetylase